MKRCVFWSSPCLRNFNEFKHVISDLPNSLGGSEKMTNRSSLLLSFCVSETNRRLDLSLTCDTWTVHLWTCQEVSGFHG